MVPEVRAAVAVAVETLSHLLVDLEEPVDERMLLSQAVCLMELLLR